jgi:hypothetical protein
MTTEAWDAVLAYSLIFGPFVALTVGSFFYLVFQAKRNPPADFYEPYGDATDTPQMRLNTRRVNFHREDV